MKRRDILYRSTLALAGGMLGPHRARTALAGPMGKPIGLQMSTVRDQLAKDVPGTIEKVAKIGYREVEFYEFHGKSAKELRRILDANGLSAPSGHYKSEQISGDWSRQIADAHDLGLKYMVKSAGPFKARSLDDYKKLIEPLGRAAERTRAAGMRFCYHTHNFEFKEYEGTTAFDFLVGSFSPDLVSFQLDCFWVTHAGRDPVTCFKKYPGRFPLMHVKDLKRGNPPGLELDGRMGLFAEVGRGTIDWKRIFAAAPIGGVKHYYVEQDWCERPSLESARISYDYLRSLPV